MKIEVECYYKNIRFKMMDFLRVYKTLSEPPTVEWIINEHIPIPEKDINTIEVFSNVRDSFVELYPLAIPYTKEEVLEKFKDNSEKRELILEIIESKEIV